MTHGLLGMEYEIVRSIRDGLVSTYDRLRDSDVVVITLGYNEAWYFKDSGAWVNQSAAEPKLRAMADRFSFEILDFGRVYAILTEAIQNFRRINENIKIILTISPVPLGSTFSSEHLAVANHRSKSTLHSVAQKLFTEYDFLDYFPSYEIVSLSNRELAFEKDNIHVKQSIVSHVMDCFFEAYL